MTGIWSFFNHQVLFLKLIYMETFTDKELKNLVRWTAYTILYAGYICVLVDYLIKVYDGHYYFNLWIIPYLMSAGVFAKVVVPLRIVLIVLSLLILTIIVINVKIEVSIQ